MTLDDPATLALALEDPTGFVAGPERMAIDEVQRAPDLLLALKVVVDTDQSRGRFLISGSANVITHPRVADSLPGRVEYLTLWPLSQAELVERRPTFLEAAFAGETPRVDDPPVGRAARLRPRCRDNWARVAARGGSVCGANEHVRNRAGARNRP